MDLEKISFPLDEKGATAAAPSCSICLEVVLDRGGRSIARLQCGHEFHLDCIGSAFNAKGAMQCPNCRKVEKGRWLYANGHLSYADFDIDGWMTEDMYDLGYPEVPVGFQWCPFRRVTQLTSLFEEAESQLSSYHELMGNPTFREHSTASSSSHICPHLALHGFSHAMHAAPSSSSESATDNGRFHRLATNMGGPSSAEINSQSFPANNQQNHNWWPLHPLSFTPPGNADQSESQYGLRLPRSDNRNQQRLGPLMNAHTLLPGSVAPGGNSLVGPLGLPVMDEVRSHARGPGSHIYPQSLSSSSLNSSLFPPVRRMRPRGLALVSASSSTQVGGFYGFSIAGSVSRNHQEGENIGRHIDHFYRWRRDRFNPLPWIPFEGEPQWWSPFNPNQNRQPGSLAQRGTAERVMQQSYPGNGYQHMPPHLPPYM